jgi:2-polyprenyl-6-methoxyphenol hydroxylase-like FAD-dependent oxidoreductase
MYDAIVVGARCAGSPTAMLLARKGYRVLLVDKAFFPSDVVNGYYVQQHPVARMHRWGLLHRLRDSNCPPITVLKLDFGDLFLRGSPPPVDGIPEAYAPRRFILDKLLAEAAVGSGVEFRDGFPVEGLLWDENRVVGIRSRTRAGALVTERARIVIGADGGNSVVARSTQAPIYNTKPTLTCWYIAHWSGVVSEGIEVYVRARRCLIKAHTNDGLTVVIVGYPFDEFPAVRADPITNYQRDIDLVPEFAEHVRSGKQEDRLVGSANTANYFRRPYGPGWALVGDAGYHHDPSTAQGINDSFRDAELLSEAIHAGLSGQAPMEIVLDDYEQTRNAAVMPMYEFTAQLANLVEPPAPEMLGLLQKLSKNQAQTNRFLGVWAGTVPVPEFFTPENLAQI